MFDQNLVYKRIYDLYGKDASLEQKSKLPDPTYDKLFKKLYAIEFQCDINELKIDKISNLAQDWKKDLRQ